jgi:excisionase family DNA binding protein
MKFFLEWIVHYRIMTQGVVISATERDTDMFNNQTQVLLRARDIAFLLNISLPYAYRLMQTGEIRTVKMGRSVRVRKEDLIDFIKSNMSISNSGVDDTSCFDLERDAFPLESGKK